MSVAGLCQVCQSAEADVQCDRCGNLVCEDHFDREMAVCAECAAELGGAGDGRGEGGGPPGRRRGEDDPDVDHYQF